MPIGNQIMRSRVGTYNFSRKVLKPKIFSSEENNFYTVHCLSKIMAYLVLMLYHFLSICLVIFIFNQILFFYAVTTYNEKSNAVLFINDYFRTLPFVALLLLRSGDVETNPGPKKLSVIKFCHWNLNSIADYFVNRRFYYHSQLTQIICLSETFLDFTLYQHDESVMINGY